MAVWFFHEFFMEGDKMFNIAFPLGDAWSTRTAYWNSEETYW
jgi:hypothetical protein